MTCSVAICVRINKHVKVEATKALDAMGLSLSDAVRVFLTCVANDKQMPFKLKEADTKTSAGSAMIVKT
jgi:DNA-damage-inducible protein J